MTAKPSPWCSASERKKAEEQVDRHPLAARLVEFGRRYFVCRDVQAPVGRDDVHVVRLQRLAGPDLDNRHGCPRRQDARQLAMAPRMEMDDDNEGGAGVRGKCLEEGL
jgi:hypothetical protein